MSGPTGSPPLIDSTIPRIPTTSEMLVQQVTAQPDLWLDRLNDLVSRLSTTLAEAHAAQQLVQQQHAQISELKLTIAELRISELSSLRTPKSEKTPDVDRFDGTRDKLSTFVAECRIKFLDNADRYPTEDTRMNYIFTRCAGAAKEQLLPFWESDATAQKAPFTDTESLLRWLQTCFGDPDIKGTAQYKISHLRMTNREFPQYLADFNKYIERTGWNAEAQKSALLNGLSAELKNLLIHHDTEEMSIREITTLCIRLDTKLRASQAAGGRSRFGAALDPATSQGRKMPTTPGPLRPLTGRAVSTPATGANATPIVADRITTTQGGNLMDLSRHRGPLSDTEKQRRRDNGLCLYCGEPGHIAADHRNGTLPGPLRIREIDTSGDVEDLSGKE